MCVDEQPMGVYEDNFNGYPSNDPEDRAPLRYHGSHVLPEANHERAGSVSLCAVPARVRFWRGNRDAPTKDEPDGWEPYVRLGVRKTLGDGRDVVLDRDQARAMRDALTGWLEWTEPRACSRRTEDRGDG